ncbi:MAG: MBL fold metallo-hydrolase [Candidatus Thiodiazotropha sp.]
MALRFASLGSGSRGNALLLETPQLRVLIDCGFPAREVESRLEHLGVDPQSLHAILVTHEHGDHIRGVGAMARRYRLPVWLTAGTFRASRMGEIADLQRIDCHSGWFSLGDLDVLPFPVPHDAREPCQFLFQYGGRRLGLLTDAGHITPHIRQNLDACDALVLEFNHDTEMLANGPYPPSLRARVGGRHGHLSNAQSIELLRQLPLDRINCLLASHLSQKNNHPHRIEEALEAALPGLMDRLHFATQDAVSQWFQID